jgi:hypothetical protein
METRVASNGDSTLDSLLARFEREPALAAQTIRAFARSSPDRFLKEGIRLFGQRDFSPGLRCIGMTLIQDERLPARLLQLLGEPRATLIQLIRQLMRCDPHLDLKLLNVLRNSGSEIAGGKAAIAKAIDILDVVSDSMRLVPSIRHMLDDPDPRVQSKAAIFIGRRTQNLTWAQKQLQDRDVRVRANVIEALDGPFGSNYRELLWTSVADGDNRVAGNALLKLYEQGDTAAIPLIFQMAERPEHEFRSTAAWVMGSTGDSRFANALSGLLQDSEAAVRTNAFRGLKLIKTALAASGATPELQLSSVSFQQKEDAANLAVVVQDKSGNAQRDISPVSWMLWEGARIVRDYAVAAGDSGELLTVAFLTAGPLEWNGAEGTSAESGAAEEGIRRCLPLRLPDDRWAILKLRPTGPPVIASFAPAKKDSLLHLNDFRLVPAPAAVNISVRFSMSPLEIGRSLEADAQKVPGTAIEAVRKGAIEVLGPHGFPGSARHLICIGPEGLEGLLATGVDKLPESTLPESTESRVKVHVIALPGNARASELRALTESTGGFFLIAPDTAGIPQACALLYTALRHRYGLRWEGRPSQLRVELHAESGHAAVQWMVGAD